MGEMKEACDCAELVVHSMGAGLIPGLIPGVMRSCNSAPARRLVEVMERRRCDLRDGDGDGGEG